MLAVDYVLPIFNWEGDFLQFPQLLVHLLDGYFTSVVAECDLRLCSLLNHQWLQCLKCMLSGGYMGVPDVRGFGCDAVTLVRYVRNNTTTERLPQYQ